jgi:hypothetical protein
MDKVSEYRECAGECLRLAERAAQVTDRALLLAMADRWTKLAEQVRRSDLWESPEFENRVKQQPPTARIAVLADSDQIRDLVSLFRAGAREDKSIPVEPKSIGAPRLSPQEARVARYLTEGCSKGAWVNN